LTVDEKVALVQEYRQDYGLNRCCEVLGLSKGTWHYRQQVQSAADADEEALKELLRSTIIDHPGYGYRRLQVEVEARTGQRLNHKRLRRLLREANLGLVRQLPRHRPSGVHRILRDNVGHLDRVKGRSWGMLQVLSTDFTELHYAGGHKKAWLMAMVDITGKWAPGWAVGPRRNRELALQCWQQTCQSFARLDQDLRGVIVHQDQDAVYTSYDWLRALLIDAQVTVSYSENGARDNPWVESLWGRIKTEIASLLTEAQTLGELVKTIDRHMHYYNTQRRHSAIDYQAPLTHLREHFQERMTLLHSLN